MTEDVWDEIWNKPAFNFLSYSPDELVRVPGKISVNEEWLKEVKAEGDRLNREGLEHYAIAVEYYDKLEVVRKHLDTIVIPSVSDITYLKKFLEAENHE